ncbi:hypothetical protein [Mycobacterium haemophilum]|uniref:Uncharacterized protein n=1 Tax=Mycobacterium haemophilum TaxID=29311 RepID=A0A0I9ZS58_9MYCO|nr:hypothetical protein [Mycobacterium haemophilum]AKN16156.1 hypothetical protein B586_05600 [Mycobacterium haemophilum DSM 44634]KLO29908.1 hypothetical protein ABH39_11440 [Mycobacterium haemophilum]KLO38490.1 hypothetical protein ABH38_03590 [Mycobacterium haemophilum]KLO44824.1 hypothetical protein ABH37_02480 [Mycobacterium haemophilum]KLO56167.1 hypothetical protein ABH36_02465 [Mycobacterium haemophilum]
MGNALKALLQDRHLHAYGDFVAEYERRAKELDLPRPATPPTKAQYYRWVGGQVDSLPRPYHCAVLEQMFPGWTAKELFDHDEHQNQSPAKDDDHVLSPVAPALAPAILGGLWVTGYLLGGTRQCHIDLSSVTATSRGTKSRNYPPAPRAEGHSHGHETETNARLFGRHLMGYFRNCNDHYFYGSLHLAVLPGETILDGYYTGFINDTQVVAEPWRWVRVDPQSTQNIDLAEVTLGEPRRVYEALTSRTQFDRPIPLDEVTE